MKSLNIWVCSEAGAVCIFGQSRSWGKIILFELSAFSTILCVSRENLECTPRCPKIARQKIQLTNNVVANRRIDRIVSEFWVIPLRTKARNFFRVSIFAWSWTLTSNTNTSGELTECLLGTSSVRGTVKRMAFTCTTRWIIKVEGWTVIFHGRDE